MITHALAKGRAMLGVFGKLWKHRGNRLIQSEQVRIEKPHGENSGNGTGA